MGILKVHFRLLPRKDHIAHYHPSEVWMKFLFDFVWYLTLSEWFWKNSIKTSCLNVCCVDIFQISLMKFAKLDGVLKVTDKNWMLQIIETFQVLRCNWKNFTCTRTLSNFATIFSRSSKNWMDVKLLSLIYVQIKTNGHCVNDVIRIISMREKTAIETGQWNYFVLFYCL